MKIILLKDFPQIGYRNEIKKVNDGYAHNFLIPQKIAVIASPAELAKLQKSQDQQVAQIKNKAQQWLAVKEEIEKTKFSEIIKVHKSGEMVGRFSKKHILALINNHLSVKINKNQIGDLNIAFGLGENKVTINLFPQITATAVIILQVAQDE